MALKGLLLTLAVDLKHDEKFVDSVLKLLAQPGWINISMLICGWCCISLDCRSGNY